VLFSKRMAGQAAFALNLRRNILENKYLGLVSSALDMGLAGAVAGFAALLRFPSTSVVGCFPVRGLLEVVVNLFMAGLAGLSTNIARRSLLSLCVMICLVFGILRTERSCLGGLWPAQQIEGR